MKLTRKDFIKTLGVTGAAAMLGVRQSTAAPSPKVNSYPFQMGLASYSFRKFSLEETIAMAKQIGMEKIALKSMHLPLEASPAEIKAAAQKVRDAGLKLYGAGVIYMKTEAEVNNAFEYAKTAGMDMIIGVPNHELLPLVDKKVKEYDIKLAIHNHGPGDDLYSSPNDVNEKIKGLDKRIGFCIDIGHVVRIKEDPAELIVKYKDRLYDLHFKDVNKAEADGTPVEVGRGVIDIPSVLKALLKINYSGSLGLEYEKDADNPLPGAAESVGYVKGVLKMI